MIELVGVLLVGGRGHRRFGLVGGRRPGGSGRRDRAVFCGFEKGVEEGVTKFVRGGWEEGRRKEE
jgi:hypothetical protein